VFFTADDGVHGRELWKSDGTRRGTVLVKDINPATDTYPSYLNAVGDTVFFTADDGVHGRELWKSDGTKRGTVMVKDINPGTSAEYAYGPDHLTAVGGRLFFTASDGIHGRELWKSDGTKSGTALVKNIDPGTDDDYTYGPSYLTAVGGKLFFIGPGAQGRELWKSNGTKAGTVIVKLVKPGGATDEYDTGLAYLTAAAGNLYFSASDSHGTELWKSNGTTPGTVMVKDIMPGFLESSFPTSLSAAGGKLFFTADDSHGRELWKSNGTQGGTVLVKDINPGTFRGNYGGSYPLSSDPGAVTAVGRRMFFTAKEGVHGRELWTSDGSKGRTAMVKDIRTGQDNSAPSSLTAVGETLFFAAGDGVHGRELWKSDGTKGGTVPVKDIRSCSGPDGGRPSSLTPVGTRLFFVANDGVHGIELWRSDGTRTGTVLVKDIKTDGS
jgi:ELWxxDGT repeat protein